jgi:DNA-nicking Smr family endonuclease
MTPTRTPADPASRNLDPDDARILAEALADVTPLSEESRQRVVVRSAPQRAAIGLPDRETSDHDSNVFNNWTSGYAASGVRRDRVRQLKRGEIPVERTLDLHGCTVEEALGRLRQFVAGCRSAGVRCVRVVHGKGMHSPSGGGVLRDRVWEHLTRRKDVLMVEFAQLRDGGQGAVHVLLRK